MTSVSSGNFVELKKRLKRQLSRQRNLMAQMERINAALLESMEAFAGSSAVGPADMRHRVHGRENRQADPSKFVSAVIDGDLRWVRQQLALGADPNLRGADGDPILLMAAAGHNSGIVRELIKAGARIDERDGAGNTALLTCARDEDIAIVKELVKAGADVNAKNSDGDSPLTNAACWGAEAVVKYLIAHSADPKMPDGLGVSAAELANQHGHKRIAKLLRRTIVNE